MSNRIGELRREKGLTLKKMGELLNIRDNTLSQYETGKREPQLGLMIEIAAFFNVSVEYLMGESVQRDFPIKNDEDALSLLKKMNSNEINSDHLSKITALNLSLWVMNNYDLLVSKYKNLYETAYYFVKHIESENKTLKLYSSSRKNENKIINEIINKLEFEETFNASPKTVLDFMEQAERIGYRETSNVIKYMMEIPTEDDDY